MRRHDPKDKVLLNQIRSDLWDRYDQIMLPARQLGGVLDWTLGRTPAPRFFVKGTSGSAA